MKTVKAPTGTNLSCKNWLIEAPMRMLMNNLDPDIAEKPEELIVYGGIGKAARNWDCYDRIIESLKNLNEDESLLVQSGKPVGVIKTHKDAPKVLISNSMLVPNWANWEHFRELDKKGLMMYGQMTAGSWIYIGTQGILQGTYETFAAAGQTHYGTTDLSGKLILTAGLGGMGGAQTLAATMCGATCLAIEVDPERVEKRIKTKYVDEVYDNLDEALSKAEEYKSKKIAKSIALIGNAAEILPQIAKKGIVPDLLTDQTSAHDELNGYIPKGYSLEEALDLRKNNPDKYVKESIDSMGVHVQAMLKLQQMGAHTFDYGNNIRAQAQKAGVENAFDFQGFVPLYIRPLFCEGKGPFRWVALSGDPEDIYTTDEAIKKAFPEDKALINWLNMAKERVTFQGLPSRICWLGLGAREKAGLIFNDLVRTGKVKAPIVIGRDHLDCGSVASPNRETEAMKDGSDAVADWPILNLLSNAVCGATWVSFHHGGGVGLGYSLHAGMVIVADGTQEADERLKRVLTADPSMGIFRHADAGYDKAISVAKDKNVNIPFLK